MSYIICNIAQKNFIGRLLTAASINENEVDWIFDDQQLEKAFSVNSNTIGFVLIEASLNWHGNLLQNFYGFDIAADLRSLHAVKCPIIFLSTLKKSYFEKLDLSDNKYGLLNGLGSSVLSFPFTSETLIKALTGTEPLTDAVLRDVVIKYCGLQATWSALAHEFEKTLLNYPERREEAQRQLAIWAESINRYAPDQKQNLENLQDLLNKTPPIINEDRLRDALQVLGKGLLKISESSDRKKPAISSRLVPNDPPEYFSKVLIADDEDRSSIISGLRQDYHYEVLEQARTSISARQLLDKEHPEVVLADWHFPEKSDGLAFINYALKRKYPPLILVTSRGPMKDEELRRAGLPDDVINCTGPYDAANASTIHRKIWLGANRDNVFQPVERHPETIGLTLAQTCRERLERYAAIVNSHAHSWQDFAPILRYTIKTAQLILPTASGDEIALIRRVIEILELHQNTDEFSLETIVDIIERIEREHETARRPPESEAKQLLRGLLHGKIEQFSGILGEIENIFEQLDEVAADLLSLPAHQEAALTIQTALAEYRQGDYTRQQYSRLGDALSEVCSTLPIPTIPHKQTEDVVTDPTKKIRLVVAEDDPHWQNIIRLAVAEVKTRLADSGFVIDAFFFDNAGEACKAVPKPRKEREIAGPQPAGRMIVISDICLPKDRFHADQINDAVAEKSNKIAVPHRTHGLKLIQGLREYAYNIPVIVLSTVDAIEDRLAVGDWGVPDINYISKGVDDYRSVVQALIRLIEKKSKHRLEKIETEERVRFRIDGIEIKFTPEEKHIFSDFFLICQRKEEARRKGKQGYEPGATIDDILEELVWDGSKENRIKIEKDFNSIRERILESFRQARLYISTHEIIKSIRRDNGDFAYQIIAEIPTLEEQDARAEAAEDLFFPKREPCKVLVVENNKQNFEEIIVLLRKLGYKIKTATNVEDAVSVATKFHPDILCLEMNLPMTYIDYERDPLGSVEESGLYALEQIQTFLHDVRVAIPTTKYNDNRLLAKATQVGLSARDFVDKRRANWLAWLAAVIGKHHREILFGEVAGGAFDAGLPLVEILDGSDLYKGVLKLRVNGKLFETKNPRYVEDERDADVIHPILGLLLQHPNEPLAEAEVESLIGKGATKDMWKTWRKRLREIIREWLEVKKADFKTKHDDPSHKILVYKESHLTLHVNVIRRNKA